MSGPVTVPVGAPSRCMSASGGVLYGAAIAELPSPIVIGSSCVPCVAPQTSAASPPFDALASASDDRPASSAASRSPPADPAAPPTPAPPIPAAPPVAAEVDGDVLVPRASSCGAPALPPEALPPGPPTPEMFVGVASGSPQPVRVNSTVNAQ